MLIDIQATKAGDDLITVEFTARSPSILLGELSLTHEQYRLVLETLCAGERFTALRLRAFGYLAEEAQASDPLDAEYCADNTCEREDCHRCFPRLGCRSHEKCREVAVDV